MRAPLFLLALVSAIAWLARGAQPEAVSVSSGTNNLVIVCTNGAEVTESTGLVVFHGEVRVLEPQMYLECELMTLRFQTNSSGGIAKSAGAGLTNVDARIEMIVAETNVMIMARGTTILGDKAVYTASNEVMVVTGSLVIIENEKSYTYGDHFVFNRKTGSGYAVGPTVVEIKMEGTNTFKPTFGPGRKPAASTNAPAGRESK
jgi:lipopolysaccharide export system protein LptA